MNDLYNAQDIILLCEISFYFRFRFMHDQYSFNPRKCNSASTLSGCIEREMSRVIIAFSYSNEAVDIFEQTITGVFSLVNTRLAFDTEILLPNLISNNEKEKTGEFQKATTLKFIIYHMKKSIQKKRVITKISKLDENNQYGFGMIKPLPTGCIKQNLDTNWRNFNLLLQDVSLNDQTGHLYVVDIELIILRLQKKKSF